jgi:hypothetical protein
MAKGRRRRDGRPADPVPVNDTSIRNRREVAAPNAQTKPERMCPLMHLTVSFDDPEKGTVDTAPILVYDKDLFPDQVMTILVIRCDDTMGLDFVTFAAPTSTREGLDLKTGKIAVRLGIPDDRYTISFRVYLPTRSMEITRWPKTTAAEVGISLIPMALTHDN